MDKIRKSWQDFAAGEITPESAAEQMFTKNAELHVNLRRKDVDGIYKGRKVITKFLENVRSRNQTNLKDVQFEKCSENRLCTMLIHYNIGTELIVSEITMNKDENLIEHVNVTQKKGMCSLE